MKVEFQEPKTVNTIAYIKPVVGSFAVENNELQWMKCREQFADFFTEAIEGFYFSHDFEKTDGVAQFIARTEEIIGVTESLYAKTNRNWVLWVQPNDFWKSCPMRRSLFTILLRCGLTYIPEKDNYEDSLYSQDYIKETQEAVKRFLFGFTRYDGPAVKGWVTAFRNADRDMVRKQLLMPYGQNSQNMIGLNSLWA